MTQDNSTIHTLRLMAYSVEAGRLTALYKKDKFRDLIKAGSMLNAVVYARRSVPYELASFAMGKTTTEETLYLKGGVLFGAMALCDAMVTKYPDQPYTWEMHSIIRSYRDCSPPKLLLDMRSFGLFRLYSDSKVVGNIRDLGINGRSIIFRPKPPGIFGIPLARIADKHLSKRELINNEVHGDIDSMIGVVVEDIVLALEGFIVGMAKELGLDEITGKKDNFDLGLLP